MFNCKRLTLARKRRGLTAKGIAGLAALSPLTITRLEKGDNNPDEETVQKIANALSYPISFFYRDDPESINLNAVSFRSLTKMTAKERDAALSAGDIGVELFDWVEDRFALPKSNLIDLSYETNPEIAARTLRQHWGIGEKPIPSMIKLLEFNGVRILSLSENTAHVDAYSFWRGSKPYVFLNNNKTAEHSTFDAAHELGHLVMHRHGGPQSTRDAEKEANTFASAFLMPRDDVRSRVPRLVKVDTILTMKRRWRVSAMAMAYRLHSLKLLTDWQYKSVCIELSRRGYRSGEPNGLERDKSTIWHKVLTQLWSERITKNEIANALDLPLDELEGFIQSLISLTTTDDKRPNKTSIKLLK